MENQVYEIDERTRSMEFRMDKRQMNEAEHWKNINQLKERVTALEEYLVHNGLQVIGPTSESPKTSEPAKVLVEILGGCAEVRAKGNVEILIFDWDNVKEGGTPDAEIPKDFDFIDESYYAGYVADGKYMDIDGACLVRSH